MLRNTFHALAYWAPMLIIFLAVGGRAAAPFPYGSADVTAILTVGVSAVARELNDRSTVYVTVDGSDPSTDLIAALNRRNGPPLFAPGKTRSLEVDRCRAVGKGMVIVGRCLQDNLLSADLLSMPLWHVALVRVKSLACTAELTLVQGVDQWHVLSQRTACT